MDRRKEVGSRLSAATKALKIVAISQLAAAVLLRSLTLLQGWKADVTFPFGLFNPLVELPIFAYVLLGAPVAILGLLAMRWSRINVGAKALAVAGAIAAIVIAAPTPLMPNALDALTWRLKSFPEAEFAALARDVRVESARTPGQHGELSRRATEALAREHPLLRPGGFPVRIYVREESVSFYWASGLTGGFEVTIGDGDAWPPGVPAPNIHENVAAYWK